MAYDPREIATSTFYDVLQTPDRKAQRLAARYDSTRCVLKVVSGYHPRLFIADVDEVSGDSANPRSPISGLPVRAGRER